MWAIQERERRPERQAEIRTRIAISNRKDIDFIEKILVVNNTVNAGDKCVCEDVAVQVVASRASQVRRIPTAGYSRGNRNVKP